jgi:hypothetical protein
MCHRILTKDTFDEIQMDRIEGKHELQKDLRVSIEDYIKNKYQGAISFPSKSGVECQPICWILVVM